MQKVKKSLSDELKELKIEWRARKKEKEEMNERIKKLESKSNSEDTILRRLERLDIEEEEQKRKEKRLNIVIKEEELIARGTAKETAEKLLKKELNIRTQE